MSAHDRGDVLCECADCVAEDLALLRTHPDPLAQIAASIHTQQKEPQHEDHPAQR